MFWELLDPKICQMTQVYPTSPDEISRTEHIPDARMRVTTHFVHPLEEDQAERPPTANHNADAADTFFLSPEDLEQVSIDELFSHFAPDNFNWLQT
jgi:hypothetical protein